MSFTLNKSKWKIIIFLGILCFCVWLIIESMLGKKMSIPWRYELPNGYFIKKVNIDLVYMDYPDDTNIDKELVYISSFCYNERWIAIKRIDRKGFHNTVQVTSNNPDYYLIDTINNILYGPTDKTGLDNTCSKERVLNMCKWIDTSFMPQGAITD